MFGSFLIRLCLHRVNQKLVPLPALRKILYFTEKSTLSRFCDFFSVISAPSKHTPLSSSSYCQMLSDTGKEKMHEGRLSNPSEIEGLLKLKRKRARCM